MAAEWPNIKLHFAYSRPRDKDRQDNVYDSEGSADGALLASVVQEPDARYFLSGPTGFMSDIQGDLERRGVPAEHIHTEFFGPIS